MDYFLNEQQKSIVELTAKIAKERVLPARAELDEKEEFPWEIMKILADAGLFGIYIPEEYGGLGFGNFENCLAVEELSKVCIGVSVSFAASGLGAYPILLFGNEENRISPES
jgi:butyryl-CoA dehydrogenase